MVIKNKRLILVFLLLTLMIAACGQGSIDQALIPQEDPHFIGTVQTIDYDNERFLLVVGTISTYNTLEQLRVYVTEETVLSYEMERQIQFEDLFPDQKVEVWSGGVAESDPPQTGAYHVNVVAK